MNIAIVGTGAIGSTLAFQLARHGHQVTCIARGQRLSELTRDGAVVLASGERQAVQVAAQLDVSVAYDVVLVTVLAPQVEAVLPALRASKARQVMFMFNTFESVEPLRAAVGAERFTLGFPMGVLTVLRDGRISPQIRSGTTVADAVWAKHFSEAGIPTVVEADMQSWLRAHAALVYPLMAISVATKVRGAPPTLAETTRYVDAWHAGFEATLASGSAIRPEVLNWVTRLPRWLSTVALWGFSRSRMARVLAELGPAEPRMLADMMSAAQPALGQRLLAVRP